MSNERLGQAEQGDAAAQFRLGLMYSEGHGVPQHHAEAAKWYRLAADRRHPQAQYNLGLLYATGEGVAQDNVMAHMSIATPPSTAATSWRVS